MPIFPEKLKEKFPSGMKTFTVWFLIGVVFLFGSAEIAEGSVRINEVAWMGTAAAENGSYCEWIELSNNGSESVDLAGWMLRIGSTEKVFSSDSGATLNLASGSFYLIERLTPSACPDPVPGVAADWSVSFGSGISNSGTVITLKDSGGSIIDTVDASKGWETIGGDNASKETAQRTASGNWITSAPTPKAATLEESNGKESKESEAEDAANEPTSGEHSGSVPSKSLPRITAVINGPSRVVAGADSSFTGTAYGLKDEPIPNARHLWNFGDGSVTEGKSVSHLFRHPGRYIVVLDVASGEYIGTTKITVEAVAPPLSILRATGGKDGLIEVGNTSGFELDISNWHLKNGDVLFTFPARTYLGAKGSAVFPASVTNIVSIAALALLFPNGAEASRFTAEKAAPPPKPAAVSVEQAAVTPVALPQVEEKIAIEEKTEENNPVKTVALVSEGRDDEQNSEILWLFGVFALIAVGIGAFMMRGEAPQPLAAEADIPREAAEAFEIIEEERQ